VAVLNVSTEKKYIRRLKNAFDMFDYIAIKKEIRSGDMQVFLINGLVIATREEPQNRHFVIVGAQGAGLKRAIPQIYMLAKSKGFNTIRFHNDNGKFPKMTNAKLIRSNKKEYVFEVTIP
jgi:hypothetical protein